MATPTDWARAYLEQARADLAAAAQPMDPSVRAMLLQMSLEKIAKAALLKNGQWSPNNAQTTHRGASHMMTQVLRSRVIAKTQFARPVVEFTLKPMVDMLENLHPANCQAGPWLEYPWLTPRDQVEAPCTNLPNLADYTATSNRAAPLAQLCVAPPRATRRDLHVSVGDAVGTAQQGIAVDHRPSFASLRLAFAAERRHVGRPEA